MTKTEILTDARKWIESAQASAGKGGRVGPSRLDDARTALRHAQEAADRLRLTITVGSPGYVQACELHEAIGRAVRMISLDRSKLAVMDVGVLRVRIGMALTKALVQLAGEAEASPDELGADMGGQQIRNPRRTIRMREHYMACGTCGQPFDMRQAAKQSGTPGPLERTVFEPKDRPAAPILRGIPFPHDGPHELFTPDPTNPDGSCAHDYLCAYCNDPAPAGETRRLRALWDVVRDCADTDAGGILGTFAANVLTYAECGAPPTPKEAT